MEKSEKLDFIINSIKSIKSKNIKLINKAKKSKILYYSENINLLENVSFEKIKQYDFKKELIEFSFKIEKHEYFSKFLFKRIYGLENHIHSPEQNKLFFDRGNIYINTPNKTNISDAITFIINNNSLESLKNL